MFITFLPSEESKMARKKQGHFKLFIVSLILFALSTPSQAKIEIIWWHAMGGQLDQWVNDLANDFNKTQDTYLIKPVFKGSYAEVMNASIAALRSGTQPHIVQVYEVGTAAMLAAKGAIYPLYELMKDAKLPFDQDDFLPAIRGYYSTSQGEMLSLPFNSSTAVFYYNKDAFVKAGLDPNRPPKTWAQVHEYSQKLQTAGYACGFTTSWPSWILLENMGAWHNQPLATKANGFDGLDTRFIFNNEFYQHHFSKLAEWKNQKIYEYAGRQTKGKTKFVTEHCAMFMSSSGALSSIKSSVQFDFGVARLPFWKERIQFPQNSIIGGATLWVLQGHKTNEYKGIAEFFNYITQPDILSESHKRTGYLPLTQAAYRLTKSSGFYQNNPGAEIPILQLTNKTPTQFSKGLRFGNFLLIREIIEQELENLWSGKKPVHEVLDEAVHKSNKILEDFERLNQ